MSFSLFLFYIVSLPLLMGFSTEILSYFSLGLIWLCILFTFLSESLFQSDYEDGSMELYLCSYYSLESIILTKVLAYWCLKIGGILCTFPFISLFYKTTFPSMFFFIASLLFTCICAMHSSFTLGIKQHNLQSLTALPTLLPCLLISTSIQDNSIFFLLGYLFLFLCCVPIFISLTLRNLLSQ